MVIFKIQTYLDVVSGQKLQKLQKKSFLSDHDNIFLFYKEMVHRTRNIYKDNSVGN